MYTQYSGKTRTNSNKIAHEMNPSHPHQPQRPPTNPDLTRRSIKERLIQLLALKPFKKPELYSRLKQEGIKEKERSVVNKILSQIGTVKDNRYHLRSHIWNDVNEDWPFYTEKEKCMLKRRKPQNLTPPVSSDSTNSLSPSASPGGKRPSVVSGVLIAPSADAVEPPAAKKQRISHYRRPSPPTSGYATGSSGASSGERHASDNEDDRKNVKKDNVAWHRPQCATSRVEDELIYKSSRALASTTDPLDKLRLLCLSRGSSGIMILGRIFRKMDHDGRKQLNKEDFFNAIKDTGLDISDQDIETLFARFDAENSGYITVDDLIRQIRPPMSDSRHAIVEQAFRKLDKSGEGIVPIEDLRRIYSVTANPRYMSGEDSEATTMSAFLAHFETESTVDGKVTLEEFMNYYSGISVSIDNDGYFDLMMRQAYKL